MDVFIEQLVTKKQTAADVFKKAGILIGGFVAAVLVLTASFMFGLGPIGVFAAIGAAYLCKKLMGTLNVEYEYIVTNNDLDIDKIMSKSKRKRLTTVKIDSFTDFGEYTHDVNLAANATVDATDGSFEGTYYALFTHKTYGKTILLFTPNQIVLESVIKSLPAPLRTTVKK